MNISEQIAEWLVNQGIDTVFTVTGGGAMFLNQALCSHEEINCIYMHHEQACAMAAEGYARISGKPAVLMLTTGPGSINGLNGVFGAFTDSIPMIVISGQTKRETCLSFNDTPELRQLGDQEVSITKMVKPICKYVKLIKDVNDLVKILPEAFAQAITNRPGPVWIDIPLDIQNSENLKPIPISRVCKYQLDCKVSDKDLNDIIKRLIDSSRPLILAGTGVRLSNSVEQLLSLAEKINIPITTAWTHDLIDSDHRLFAGRPGTIGTRSGNFCLQNADFVLILGSRLNIRQTSYNYDSFSKNAWTVHVDIDKAELEKPTTRTSKKIHANIGGFLNAFETELKSVILPDFSPWVTWCKDIRKEFSVEKEHLDSTNKQLNPYNVVSKFFSYMRNDDIVVCGNASACIIPFQIGKIKSKQRMFSNSGSASMGYDLPAAIGAALADTNRRVVCFAGDGSLQMNIQELQTLKTLDLNIVVIVINNGGYLSIKQTHESFFGNVVGCNPSSGIEFPNFVKVSEAYGIHSMLIENENDLNKALLCMNDNRPLLLNIIVDDSQEFIPRIKSRIDSDGKFSTPELDDMFPFLDKKILNNVRASAKLI